MNCGIGRNRKSATPDRLVAVSVVHARFYPLVYKICGGKEHEQSRIGCFCCRKSNLAKKDAEKAVAAVLESIVSTVASGDKVQLVGFGTFEVRERSERTGRNPRTKEAIVIPASKQPVFKAGKSFKGRCGEVNSA